MTIAKGVQWGEPGPLPPGRPVVADDAALAALVRAQVLSGETAAPIGLTGGDLLRTLGGGPARRRPDDPEAWRFPVDALVVRREGADDAELAVAHLVAFRTSARRRAPLSRMPWFVTETLVVANAAFLGEWNIAPKGHPNDGRADVTRGVLPRRDRRRLDARLRTGTHLPHPGLVTSRPKQLDSGRGPWRLFLDGHDCGMADRVEVEVVPDALEVVR